MNSKSYNKLVKDFQTGDIVLFNGKYPISKLVEELEHSKWSHVGMVVRPDPEGEVYFFESTALTNLADVLEQDHKTGPKLVKLIDRLKTYGADLVPYVPPVYAVRPILKHKEVDENKLFEYIKKVHGIPNPSEWKMIEEVIEGRIFSIDSKSKDYTCSKLIGETLSVLGFYQPIMPLNGLMPMDFSSDSKIKQLSAIWEEEIYIELEKEEAVG